MNYSTLLYLLPYAVIIIGCVAGVFYWRKRVNEKIRCGIAQDLHDDLGSSLSNICILSDLVSDEITQAGKSARTKELLEKISSEAIKVNDAISDTITVLGASCRNLGHLAALLNRHGHELLADKGIAFSLELPEAAKAMPIPPPIRRDIYLILKEALHNIMKHASASQVRVGFELGYRHLNCWVIDDGCGFDLNKEHAGNGLFNMKRRAKSIKGKLEIRASPDKGCCLLLMVPIARYGIMLRLLHSVQWKKRHILFPAFKVHDLEKAAPNPAFTEKILH
ncbi:MAG: hypothetical protein HUU34_06150 [Saprospiraceae bacterium]|nr:hypothetical protein [Saprospiraceae bacterium]